MWYYINHICLKRNDGNVSKYFVLDKFFQVLQNLQIIEKNNIQHHRKSASNTNYIVQYKHELDLDFLFIYLRRNFDSKWIRFIWKTTFRRDICMCSIVLKVLVIGNELKMRTVWTHFYRPLVIHEYLTCLKTSYGNILTLRCTKKHICIM